MSKLNTDLRLPCKPMLGLHRPGAWPVLGASQERHEDVARSAGEANQASRGGLAGRTCSEVNLMSEGHPEGGHASALVEIRVDQLEF